MRRADGLLFGALALLAGCGSPPPGDGEGAIDTRNPLERAARERGIVRAEAGEPAGVFERAHDLGRDAMCVVPDGPGRWRFALTAAFGPGLSCTTKGTLVRAAEGEGRWRLSFAGTPGCDVAVREEDDELALPGRLPPQCANLCPERASLAGLRLPRASWSEEDARRLQIAGKDGNRFRPCDR